MAAGKSDVLVKLVLVFFISLLSFSIGTFVGKNYSDNQHRRAALEPQNSHRAVASLSDKKNVAETSQTMSDDEISRLAEEFVDEDALLMNDNTSKEVASNNESAPSQTQTQEKKQAPAEPVKGTSAPAITSASTPAQNIVAGQPAVPAKAAAPAQKTAENRLPSSIPKDVAHYSVGKYTVQIAAFPTETDAKARAEDLKNKGYSAFYVPANVKGKTWYRVSVGLFATEEEAKAHREEIMAKAKLTTAIIQKITQ